MPSAPTPAGCDVAIVQETKIQDAKIQDALKEDEPNADEMGACSIVAILPTQVKTVPIKKRIIAALSTKSLESVTEEFVLQKAHAESAHSEAEAEYKERAEQAAEALAEFKDVQSEVDAAIVKEIEAAKEFAELKRNRGKEAARARQELYEASKKLALLEVFAVSKQKAKAFSEARKAAQEEAELAKKSIAEEKQRQRQAIQAIERATADACIEPSNIATNKPGAKRSSDISYQAAAAKKRKVEEQSHADGDTTSKAIDKNQMKVNEAQAEEEAQSPSEVDEAELEAHIAQKKSGAVEEAQSPHEVDQAEEDLDQAEDEAQEVDQPEEDDGAESAAEAEVEAVGDMD